VPAPISAGRRHALPLLVAGAVAIGVGALFLVSAAPSLRPAPRVTVSPVVFERSGAESAEATSQPSRPSVQAPGWLEADPYYVACTALADGVVEEMLVLEGERVEKGQVVARLVPDDAELALARAEAELALRRAELRQAEADRRAAQTDWDHPVERERAVDASTAALAEVEAELAQLPHLIAAAEATYQGLREELDLVLESFEVEAASDIEITVRTKEVESQRATVEAIRKRGPILEAKRERLVAERRAAERHAELRIMERQALDRAIASEAAARAMVERAVAARDEAQLRLDRMTIESPIDGLVQRRIKVPGDKVMLGMDEEHSAHLLHLYDPSSIQVRVDVPLADAAHIGVGQRCEVVVDVLPDRTFEGEVTRITHEADLQKNTLQVKVRVIDPEPILKPEMLTRVKFLGDPGVADSGDDPDTSSRVLVPEDAIRSGEGRSWVWVVRARRQDRGVASIVPVETLSREDGWVGVRAELRPGDLLAVGDVDLAEGRRVRVTGGAS